jgi:hypothetical protein
MKAEHLFEKLWIQYSCENPSAGRIYDLFKKEGERVINDHIAFRTVNDPRVNIEVLGQSFLKLGFVEKESYYFDQKKLNARHYEHPEKPELPRVFISELLLEEFSNELRHTIIGVLDDVPAKVLADDNLILSGSIFHPTKYETYNKLRNESEYAAWFYVYGFRANHFTVSVNNLEKYNTLGEVNNFLKNNGFKLNSSGGEIKGSPEQLLEQSSTLADMADVEFSEGIYRIPKCYYEFALRYPDENGKLFSGFIARSADKIFESTDFRKD